MSTKANHIDAKDLMSPVKIMLSAIDHYMLKPIQTGHVSRVKWQIKPHMKMV